VPTSPAAHHLPQVGGYFLMADEQSQWWDVVVEGGGTMAIPRHVMRRTDLSVAAKMLLCFMLDAGWNTEQCWLSTDNLCAAMGVKQDALRRYIRELRDAGLIEVVRRGLGLTNLYIMDMPGILGIKRPTGENAGSGPRKKRSQTTQKAYSGPRKKRSPLNMEELQEEELQEEELEAEAAPAHAHERIIAEAMATLSCYEAFIGTDGFWRAVDTKYAAVIDINEELEKLTDWAEQHERAVTRGFVLNWLKRAASDQEAGGGRANNTRRIDGVTPETRAAFERWGNE
jgi:hypothetical protein